ncbi:MAG: hypothetical protein M1541_07975 [Acidobacteria bacterium]|nr:hypothetical protein [Acidobacteriota bacterium]
MAQHVKILAILHIIFGGMGILAAVVVMLFFGGLAGLVATGNGTGSFAAAPFLGGIGWFVSLVLLALALPGVIAGVGLLEFRPWARILTIILSAFDLFSVPFGTALGIYGLWVLLSNETAQLFTDPPLRTK